MPRVTLCSMRRILRVATIGLLFVASAIAPARGDDFGGWHALSVKYLDTDHWTLAAFGQLRYRDSASELFAYQLSQQVTYKASRWLHLGLNYSYLPFKRGASDEFLEHHRLEPAITPRWIVNEWLTLDLRNRIDLSWIENTENPVEKLRERPQAVVRIKGLNPLESIFINNEFFYDFDAGRYNENRFIPLGLNFRLHRHAGFSLYYMLRSVRPGGAWLHTHVLGTQVSVDF